MFMKEPTLYLALLLALVLGACGGGGGGVGNPPSGGGGDGGTGTPTTAWVTRSLGFAPKITAVAWNGTKYVAVSDAGQAISSTDGINWNTRTPASGAGVNDVVWGNGLFVSTSSFSGIMTSPDGTTWTSRYNCGCVDDLLAVAWSGSLFTAVGEGGRIYTSANGINWTQQTSNAAANDTFRDVAASATVQVAVGDAWTSGPLVRYSTNGTTWNTPSFDVTPSWGFNTVIWDGGKFVTNSSSAGTYTSTDGSSWTKVSAGVYEQGMAWDGSQYIGASISGAMTSTNLTNWTDTFTYINHGPADVVYASGLGQYLLVGFNGWTYTSGYVATSTDAINWTVRVGSDPKNEVIWDGSKFIALDSSGRLFTSANGLDWSSTSGITMDYSSEVFEGLAYASSLPRYAAASSNKIVSSEDGVNWTTRHNTDTFLTAQSLIWTGSKFVMVGWNGRYLNSVDGITWNYYPVSGTITPTPHLSDVAWSSSLGLYVVITASSTGNIYTSTDETSWTELGAAAPNGLYGIVWTGSRFVAVGTNGTIVTSVDGSNWTNRSIASGPTFYDVKVISGDVVAVGASGKVYVSVDDGINWTEQTTDTTNTLLAIAESPTRAIAVGKVGTVISR